MGFWYSFLCELLCFLGWFWGLSVLGRGAEIDELWPKKNWSAYHQNCCHTRRKCDQKCVPCGFFDHFGHIYIWYDSNFDSRHSNFFWAIIHLFLHPSLKQISPRIIQGSTTTHTKKSIKNSWVTHHYALLLPQSVSETSKAKHIASMLHFKESSLGVKLSEAKICISVLKAIRHHLLCLKSTRVLFIKMARDFFFYCLTMSKPDLPSPPTVISISIFLPTGLCSVHLRPHLGWHQRPAWYGSMWQKEHTKVTKSTLCQALWAQQKVLWAILYTSFQARSSLSL